MGCGGSAPAVQETSKNERVNVAANVPPVAAASPTVSNLNKSLDNPDSLKSRQAAITQAATPASDDNDDDDDTEAVGGWKVKRRVSRRLSLDVQKQPGSAQTPAWQTEPSEAEKAAWDDAADADIVGNNSHATVTTYAPPSESIVAGPGGVGMSRLGGTGYGPVADGDADEVDIGSWKPKKRGGRRLSLEVDKTPDLMLLAALQRSSSAPLGGDYARQANRQEAETVRAGVPLVVVQQMAPRLDVAKSPSNRSQAGESAITTPGAHSAKVYDFANSPGTGSDLSTNVDNDDDESTPVKRRKGRRLSLEVQAPPSGDIVAAVRRTHSTPITAAAAHSAMGAAAWAEVVSGSGGERLEEPAPIVRQTQTSSQPSGAAAGGGRQEAAPGVGGANEEAEEAEATHVRGTQELRRRSVDIYKHALAEGQSAQAAAAAAGVGTDFLSLEDLMADTSGGDFSSWQAGVQPGFKKKWADYGDGPQGVSV